MAPKQQKGKGLICQSFIFGEDFYQNKQNSMEQMQKLFFFSDSVSCGNKTG